MCRTPRSTCARVAAITSPCGVTHSSSRNAQNHNGPYRGNWRRPSSATRSASRRWLQRCSKRQASYHTGPYHGADVRRNLKTRRAMCVCPARASSRAPSSIVRQD
eukprot:scaffold53860_cov31-Tisochrysis_lutea.AAC.3